MVAGEKKKKKEVVSLKGNCRTGHLLEAVCRIQRKCGHQMAKHQNRSTLKKNRIEQQWLKYMQGTILYATGSEWKLNIPQRSMSEGLICIIKGKHCHSLASLTCLLNSLSNLTGIFQWQQINPSQSSFRGKKERILGFHY